MTDDLVKRLRDVVGVIIGAQSQNLEEDYSLAREAADRIEDLEEALREIQNGEFCHMYGECRCPDHARKALEGKDER